MQAIQIVIEEGRTYSLQSFCALLKGYIVIATDANTGHCPDVEENFSVHQSIPDLMERVKDLLGHLEAQLEYSETGIEYTFGFDNQLLIDISSEGDNPGDHYTAIKILNLTDDLKPMLKTLLEDNGAKPSYLNHQ